MPISVLKADYHNPRHAKDIPTLLDDYAKDPMGGNQGLSKQTKHDLVGKLAQLPYAFSILCYVDNEPAGLANCFEAFSTFQCKPLVNIHDLMVASKFRGQNISQKMLKKVEEIAYKKGCCKITLEVLSGNEVAKNAYLKYGFDGYELDPKVGNALFWQKKLC